jgi:hypothetical protein
MIDWLIIYGIVMGLLLRVLNHRRLVVAGQSGSPLVRRLLGVWVRAMIIAFIVIQGFSLHWLWPYAYNQWWDAYFIEHSLMAFALVTCPLTVVLYLLKEITFRVARDPHGYQLYDPGTGQPTLLWTNMKTPMVWYLVYWAWILFSPWLPFFKCFVQIYLLGQKSWVVFSMFWTLQ